MNIGSPSQPTDFALDLLGRYVCNTYDEALANSDANFRTSATDRNGNPLPPRGDLRPFDFVIIGGGTFGAVLAEHLWFRSTGRSERILVLEAGPFLLAEHQQNVPSLGIGNEVWGKAWNADPALNFPGLAYCVGGRSLWWGGWSPRLLDAETPAALWPQPVLDDLNAKTLPNGDVGYFRQSGLQIGVTATNDFIFGELHTALREQLFAAINAGEIRGAIDLPSLPPSPVVEIRDTAPTLSELSALADIPLPEPLPSLPADLAALQQELLNKLKLEAPLAVQARPQHAGYFPLNKFSSVPLLMKAARGAQSESGGDDVQKRVMVVPRCHVKRMNVVPDGGGRRVSGIVTERGTIPLSSDARVIVALGTIESNRLALLSFGEDGRIGAGLMAHLRSNVDIRIPREAVATLPAAVKALQTSALLLKGRHEFTDTAGNKDGTVGHFHLQITASGLGKTDTNSEAELFQKVPDIEFVQQHLTADDTHVVITIRAIGEMEPGNPNSNVTRDLNPAQIDYDERKAFVNLKPSPRDMQLWDAMDKASDDVAHAFGGGQEFVVLTPQGPKTAKPAGNGQPRTNLQTLLFYTPKDDPTPTNRGRRDNLGSTHHEAGGLKMGSPGIGVTDSDCRFHGISNAYVVGPALFPTIGSPNPMLTGVALARRLADHLVPPPPPASDAAFEYLFDGTEKADQVFARWLQAGGGRFQIVGRTLVAQPGAGGIGLLYYAAKQFDDFTLRVDFCLPHPRGDANDNSGIFVRFRDPRKPVLPGTPGPDVPGNLASVAVDTGYEIQIDEEARGDTRKGEADGFFFNRTGAIYKITSRGTALGEQDYVNTQRLAPSVWHTCEIKVQGRKYDVLLNGIPSTSFTADPAAPNEIFRGRSRSDDPDSGFVGLQVHTGRIAFANVRIKA